MFYRVHATIIPEAVKIHANGDILASESRMANLATMCLPNTPPLIDHIEPDGTYVLYRDFDTQAQAQQWVNFYQELPSLVSTPTITEVEVKQVGTYSDWYLSLTDSEKLELYYLTPGAGV
jgi:hypothetical protein